jgi:hypothetical protein
LVLVDGTDSFDPGSCEPGSLSRLLWVRCRQTKEALKAIDLLLRDDNFSIIALDLQMNASAQLRSVPATVWYRFQRLLENRAASLIVFTPQALVSAARTRLFLESRFDLRALHRSEEEIVGRLQIQFNRIDGKETAMEPAPASQLA